MPANLNNLKAGWLELESDPGLFTLLLEDFGVKGVQVEEIYDLQKAIESPVFGFIFLFKWIEERRSRRKIIVNDEQFVKEEPVINSIFFAHQIVPNSCATHALLSVLLNCEKIFLGETLSRLKEYTKDMNPENKGYAIGNTPELARAHNSHAKPEPRRMKEKPFVITTGRIIEAFHFVSYVPINGHLFELDGLKPYPIDHGPWADTEDWTEKFRRLIADRLGIATSGEPYHDIRFNLMAVVPDRRIAYESKLKTLKINRQIVLEALQQLVKVTNPSLTSTMRTALKTKVQPDKLKSSTSVSAVFTNPIAISSAFTSTVVSAAVKTTMTATDMLVSTSAGCGSVNNNSSSAGSIESNSSTPTKLRTTPSQGTSSPFLVQHPALVPHNYAKSPLLEGHTDDPESCKLRYEQFSGSEYSSSEEEDDDDDNEDEEEDDGLSDFDEDGGEVDDDGDDGDDEYTTAPETNQSLFPPPKLIHSGPGSGCPLAPNTTSPIPLRPMNVGSKDFSKPLSIQTKFETSPTPSCSSTDTSSEVGSAFNSPVRSIHFGSAQNSPNFGGFRDFRRLVVIRVGGSANAASEDSPSDASSGLRSSREQQLRYVDPPPTFREEASSTLMGPSLSSTTAVLSTTRKPVGETSNEALSSSSSSLSKKLKLNSGAGEFQPSPVGQEVSSSTMDAPTNLLPLPSSSSLAPFSPGSDPSRYPHLIEPHKFAPKDLLALLKNIENEITTCDSTLKDEIEKQKKYKIDDSRRTHNYDNFICTFLSMLDSHGLLTDLVEQHISVKRRQGINLGRLHKVKKVDTRKRKPKPRKRK